jgi:hypothetical protein
VIGRKAYRAPGRVIVPGWAFVVMFFLIGVVTAVGSQGNPGKGGTPGAVLGVIVGVSVALLALLTGAVLATNCVIVTSAGVIHRNNLRSKPIGWPEIESFTVGPGRGRMGWPALIIRLNDGSRVITNVTAFRARHPALVARELTALQADVATTAVTSQDMTAGESD